MKFSVTREIPASPETVWHALNDPVLLKACIPGCRSIVCFDDARWGAAVVLHLGKTEVHLTGKMEIVIAYPPEGYTLHFDIHNPAIGNIRGIAQAKLQGGGSDEEPLTALHFDVQMNASGKLAEINPYVIEAMAVGLTEIFFRRFTGAVTKKTERLATLWAAINAPLSHLRFRKPPSASQNVRSRL